MINHSALMMGKAEKDNIDLAKYRKKVVEQLEQNDVGNDDDDSSGTLTTSQDSFDKLCEGKYIF